VLRFRASFPRCASSLLGSWDAFDMRKLSVVVFCLFLVRVTAQAQTSSDSPAGEAVAVPPSRPVTVAKAPDQSGGIHWGSLVRQWWTWIAIEQVERIAKEGKTRNQLSGPFFRDWFDTVSVYHFDNWNDGGKVITSYVGHPAQGSIAQAIFWQNNDRVRFLDQDFHNPAYRHALLEAFAFATVDAVLWKVGPLSESSIGNVGLPVKWWDKDCKQIHIPCVDRTGVSDMVMNEVGGTAMTIGFQWLDKHVQKRIIEEHFENRGVIYLTRVLTNPTQSIANAVRFKWPWYRDNRR
jgi:hypothetical protein